MIEGKKNILAYYDTLKPIDGKDYVYWTLYKRGIKDGKPITRSSDIEGLTKNQARAEFEMQVNLLHSGEYNLVCQTSPGAIKRGDVEVEFRVPLNDTTIHTQQSQIAGFAQPAIGFVSKEEAERIADERFEKQMLKHKTAEQERRIAELEKQNKEYENESNGLTTKILGMIAGVGEQMLKAKATPAPMPAIGTLQEQTPAEQNEQVLRGQKLQEVLEKTEQLFQQDAVDYLHKLITYLEANKSFIGIIKMQVP